jgi:hypothetical protein
VVSDCGDAGTGSVDRTMFVSDMVYFEQRARREQQKADAARDPRVKSVHLSLVELYVCKARLLQQTLSTAE